MKDGLVGDGRRWTGQGLCGPFLRIQAFVLRTTGSHCCGGVDRLWLELGPEGTPQAV